MDTELCVGATGMILLYLLGRLIYPEPNKSLVNYAEAVGQVYGGEEE